MKILHLYSDWRWTGPAEPVAQVCLSLQDRGHDVLLAHRGARTAMAKTMETKVRERGIAATTRFHLDRYMNPLNTSQDLWRLPCFLKAGRFDILHMHLSHDHVIGGLCARILGGKRPVLIRTLHRRNVLKSTIPARIQLHHFTDGFLVFTEKYRSMYIDRFRLEPDAVALQPMTLDLSRFNPDGEYRDMRTEFGIPKASPVIGIVGRFQKYRRMDTFLQAAKMLLRWRPKVRFLIIGHSSQIYETVIKPIHRLDIAEGVIVAGYRSEDYVDTLACLDIFSLLMPGSDGTARAVREAMAMAKPCVVSNYGMLPEIVLHSRTGLVVPDEPETLARAWLQLIGNPQLRSQMGHAARQQALERFRTDAVGPALEEFYGYLLEMKKGHPRAGA